jgi:hypothetical protein
MFKDYIIYILLLSFKITTTKMYKVLIYLKYIQLLRNAVSLDVTICSSCKN